MAEGARALSCNLSTIQRSLTAKERKAIIEKTRDKQAEDRLALCVKKLQRKAKQLGRVPTARESGLQSAAMTKCGGYNVIVEAAGLEPRLSTKGRH